MIKVEHKCIMCMQIPKYARIAMENRFHQKIIYTYASYIA